MSCAVVKKLQEQVTGAIRRLELPKRLVITQKYNASDSQQQLEAKVHAWFYLWHV